MISTMVESLIVPFLPEGTPILSNITIAPVVAFHKVHALWRVNRKVKDIYLCPSQYPALFSGWILNASVGDKALVQMTVQVILVVRRILDGVNQYLIFSRSLQDMKNSFTKPLDISTYSRVALQFHGCHVMMIDAPIDAIVERIYRISFSVFNFLRQSLILSMRLTDIYEAFRFSKDEKNERVNEFFINLGGIYTALVEDPDSLIAEMRRDKEVIEKVFSVLHINAPVKMLVHGIEHMRNKVDESTIFTVEKKENNEQVREIG